MAQSLSIRPAEIDDLDTIIGFINDLALYEKMAHDVALDRNVLSNELFGDRPYAFVLIAEWEGAPCGFALCFYSFSTFLGKHTIYLEDLYVDAAYRGKGIGKGLIGAVAQQAHDEGCERVDWQVLDWNTPSIEFYEQLGAQKHEGWQQYRLNKAAIAALADKVDAA